MTLNLVRCLAALTFLIITFSACKKNPVDPPPAQQEESPATFTIASQQSEITLLEGMLTEGVPSDSTIKAELEVSVSSAGNWEITTDTSGGIWLSGKGHFENSGTATVTLSVHGTPAKAGAVELVYGDARFLVEVMAADEPPSSDSLYYFKIKVDGKWIAVYDTVHYGQLIQIGGMHDQHFHLVGFTSGIILPEMYRQAYYLGATIVHPHHKDSLGLSDLLDFFKPGVLSFNKGIDKAGAHLLFADTTMEHFETGTIGGNQDGSSLRIISVEDDSKGFKTSVKVKMRFNCRIYDPNFFTKSRVIELGEMVTRFDLL